MNTYYVELDGERYACHCFTSGRLVEKRTFATEGEAIDYGNEWMEQKKLVDNDHYYPYTVA